jgi:hypothetical protein
MERETGEPTKARRALCNRRHSSVLLQLLAALSLAAFGLAMSSQVAAGAAATATADPWTACTSGLDVTSSPVLPSPTGAVLFAVSAHTASDAWAVGETEQAHVKSEPFLEHWDGSTWSAQSINVAALEGVSIDFARLDSVVDFSPTDAWAGGQVHESNGTYIPLLFHWNGTAWALRQFPVGAGALDIGALSGTSGGDLWVGEQSGDETSYVAHDDGTAWNLLNAPFGFLSMASFAPGTVELGGVIPTAVGGFAGLQGELAGYQGGKWSMVADPTVEEITDISGTGPNDVWALGLSSNPNGPEDELQHFSGAVWTNIAPSVDGGVVTSTGVGDAEAVLNQPGGGPEAVQVADPDGPTITSLTMTPLTWDPSWGTGTFIRAISATSRGAVFAVGSLREPGAADVERGMVFRDCTS